MVDKLRIGVIGLGGIAQNAHLPAYEKLLDRVEIVAGSDIMPEARARAAERFKMRNTYENFREMLDAEKLDAVSVCTPPASHAEASIAAMEKGIHVLCEKPVSMNAAEAQEMVDAARRNNVKFMVAFQSRFNPDSILLHEYVEAGRLGEIYYATTAAVRRRGIPGWGAFTIKAISRGGPLIDIGVHALDHVIWLMGSPNPVSVLGVTYTKLGDKPGVNISFRGNWDPSKFETEDAAFAMIRFDNDATLYLEATWAINLPESSTGTTRIAGTKGGADLPPLRILGEDKTHQYDLTPIIPEWQKRQPPNSTQDAKVKHFVDCVLEDKQPITTPREIVNVAKVIDAIYDSADKHEMIKLA